MKYKFLLISLILPLSISAQIDSAKIYSQKAGEFEYKSFDSMYFYAEKIHQLAQQGDNPSAYSRYHAVLGVALEETSQYDSAMWHHKESLKYARIAGDSNLVAIALQHLGVVYRDISDFDMAIELLLKSLKISENGQDWYTQAMSYNCLSQVHHKIGKYQEAADYAGKVIEIGKAHDLEKAVGGGLIELGNNQIMLGKFDEGLKNLLESERILTKNNIRDGVGSIYNSIGVIYFYKGDFNSAIKNYQKSKSYFEESEDPVNAAVEVMNIGEAYIYLGQYDLAVSNLNDALNKFKLLNRKDYIANAYSYIFNLEQTRGDFEKALINYMMMDSYQDSILNEKNVNRIEELKITFETEKKEQQLKVAKAENELQQATIERSRLLIITISIIAILLIAGVLLYSSRKRYKLKVALAEEKEILQKTRFKAVIDAEEQERKRIARELHDGLGQLLSTARITVSSLGLEDNPKVNNSVKVIDMAVKEVRSISHNMMPNALVSVGLKEALKDMMRKVDESGNVKGVFQCDGEINLDESKSISLYRIAQEVVNNALKYAEASEIRLTVNMKSDQLSMIVEDDGKGFDTSKIRESTGIGWANIQARVDVISGELIIQSKMGEGTRLAISIAA